MASDEIVYNSYFHLLQSKFRAKYETARDHNWLICIPTSEALRGVDIDEIFVDFHTLQPAPDCDISSHYYSTDTNKSLVYELKSSKLKLISSEEYTVSIIAEEVGYNLMFQPYKLLIVDRLLTPNTAPTASTIQEIIDLNTKISSLKDADNFLRHWHPHELPCLSADFMNLALEVRHARNINEACELVRQAVRVHWSVLLTKHRQHLQRDARLQRLLSAAVEMFIVGGMHEEVFSVVCSNFCSEDEQVHSRSLALAGVSPEQLGAPEDFAVQLPAAVVELAALDSLSSPIEKLACLRSCLELILAQVKAALVDSLASIDTDANVPAVAPDALLPLLLAVVIQAKPLHLVSNLFYAENFQWTLEPNDALSYSLVTFRAALAQLLTIDEEQLQPRSKKVHRELALQDLILVTGEVEQSDKSLASPLDRQLASITAMIEASTREFQSPAT